MNGFRSTHIILMALQSVEAGLALIALILLGAKHAWGQYKSLAAVLVLIVWGGAVSLLTVQLSGIIERHLAYRIYFWCFWSSFIVEAILMLLFCYWILTHLFSSVPKLRFASTRVFWAIVLLWGVMSVSHRFNPPMTAMRLLIADATQLKLLEGEVAFFTAVTIFACIRPLGLQLRSPLPAFGLGLMFSAMSIFSDQLLSSGLLGGIGVWKFKWFAIFGGVAVCAQLLCWVAAVSWSEPERQIVSV
jgi:hypothetical protein